MRLTHLWISRFKNLRDFEIKFDKESPHSVLVGQNGSGKSNLIEALVSIFSDLDRRAETDFAYKLAYTCRAKNIEIDYDPQRERAKKQLSVDGQRMSISEFEEAAKRPDDRLLPEVVFGYYSGLGNRLERYFYPHQRVFDKDLRDGVEDPRRPLFYAQMVHSQFVLLGFFANRDEQMLQFLAGQLGIAALVSVRFTIKKPYWYDPKRHEGRYWGAVGKVQQFLDDLHNWVEDTTEEVIAERIDFRRTQDLPCVHLDLNSAERFMEFAKDVAARHGDFFKMLESTYMADLLHSVTVTVRLTNGETITFSELSEGEQQLLAVLGLLRFTRRDEALFLLDEPDTHLNPRWSQQYFSTLEMALGSAPASHVVMATHDPLVLAGLKRTDVIVLKRNEDGRIYTIRPNVAPKGLGVTGILMSDIFGLRTDLDPETVEWLDKKARLAAKDQLSPKDLEALAEINSKLEKTGYLESYSDPYFAQFLRAFVKTVDLERLQQMYYTDYERGFFDGAGAAIAKSMDGKSK